MWSEKTTVCRIFSCQRCVKLSAVSDPRSAAGRSDVALSRAVVTASFPILVAHAPGNCPALFVCPNFLSYELRSPVASASGENFSKTSAWRAIRSSFTRADWPAFAKTTAGILRPPSLSEEWRIPGSNR